MAKKGFVPLKELEKRLFQKEKKLEKLHIVEHTRASSDAEIEAVSSVDPVKDLQESLSETAGQSTKNLKKSLKGFSKPLQASNTQLMARSAIKGGGSPLEITLQQSESLKAAQLRISTLEEELQKLRKENESLISTAEVLKENREQLLAENEELRRNREDLQENFADEKDVLINTLEEVKREKSKLMDINKNLEKRLSADLQSIRARELTLEGQVEIIKLEGAALQREKDTKIIHLQKVNRNLNSNLL
ncbi:MAG: hypothetical protein OXB86_00640, partial [Bdellovibrionales bacterium]|nr:hypothetical protein [Bdellovibrionales bacterium]